VIVDLARGRPLDIIEGRSKKVLRAWLAAQSPAWRAGVKIAALDPAAPYRAALVDPEVGLPNATLVLDHFHVCEARQRRDRRRPPPRAAGDTRPPRPQGRAALRHPPAAAVRPRPAHRQGPRPPRGRAGRRRPLRGGRLRPRRQGAAQDGLCGRRHLHRPARARALLRVGRRGRRARTHPARSHHRLVALARCWPTSAPAAPPPAPSKRSTASSSKSTGSPGASETFDNYRTRMLLKTAVAWQTPPTPRLRGRNAQSEPAAPAFIA
jgi:hypothetical protein